MTVAFSATTDCKLSSCSSTISVVAQVVDDPAAVFLHCVFPLFPVGRANLAFLLDVGLCIDETQEFVDIAADGHVVDAFVEHQPVLVDEVSGAVRHEITID